MDRRDRRRGQPRRRMRPVIDFFQLNDRQFRERFRLSKADVNMLLREIGGDLEIYVDRRNEPISPIMQILITLRFFVTGAFYILIGDFIGISKSTVYKIVHRVCAAIATLREQFITFPETLEEIRQSQADFFIRFGFPRVIGCIDCKHIQIRSFGGPESELFRNRDNYFSINTQVVCNAHLEIIDVVARWPGSAHDSTIFNNSRLRANFEEGLYNDALLLGDAGYGLRPFLMTPITEPHTAAETLFNESLIKSRGHVERLFGIWARQWGWISGGSRLRTLNNSLTMIVAMAVLHNVVRQRKLLRIGRIIGDVNEYTQRIHNNFQIVPHVDVRQQLVNNYFNRLIYD